MRPVIPLLLLATLAGASPGVQTADPTLAEGRQPPTPTVLEGRVLDPVTGAPLAGAIVKVGPATSVADEGGAFRVEIRRRRKKPYPTTVTQPGYLEYRTWTEAATERTRTLYLFPETPVVFPDVPELVTPTILRSQFDTIYRTRLPTPISPPGSVIQRWVHQPRLVIVDHVMRTVEADGVAYWEATRRLGPQEIGLLRTILRGYVPVLTDGTLSGRRARLRQLSPGDRILVDYDDLSPSGELIVYAHESRSVTGAMAAVEGAEIVAGAVLLDDQLLRSGPDGGYARTITHELAHALGMQHPTDGRIPTVQLCSIMGNYGCLHGTHVSSVDLAIARLAHSRAPGNDRDDRDPRPDGAPGARVPTRVVTFEGAPAIR